MNATSMRRYINFVADCLLDIDKMYNVTSPFDFPDMIGQKKFFLSIGLLESPHQLLNHAHRERLFPQSLVSLSFFFIAFPL